jgi:predicted phosphodiesterase
MGWGKRWSWKGKVLLVLGLSISGFLGLGLLVFGLRLPPLQWEPAARATEMKSADGTFYAEGQGVTFVHSQEGALVFRASTPTPTLIISAKQTTTAKVVLQNVHPDALPGAVGPSRVEGLTRYYEFEIEPGIGLLIQPRFDRERTAFRFAAIGDTGGGKELQWALERAQSLGADFLLHLGDLEYQEGDLERATLALNAAKIPTYACIGNHDFHDGFDLVHKRFTEWIGPRNSIFELGGVRFLNLDTAADTWPADGGERGALMASVLAASYPTEQELVVLTHRPLHDPRTSGEGDDGDDHAIGHAAEVDWLLDCFERLGADALLHGHIHETHTDVVNDIPVYIVGNGINLPEPGPATAAGILIGEWQVETPKVHFRIEPLHPAE